VTAIPLGRPSRKRLGATHPHTPAGPAVGGRGGPRPPACAYLVLLRAEIARFTRRRVRSVDRPAGCRRLVSVALILAFGLAASADSR